MYKREKVNNLIQRELSKTILREIEFAGAMVTVTRVECSSNMFFAKVFISVIPSEKKEEAIYILEKKIKDLQKDLNKKLKIRPVPRIEFVKEKKIEEAARIEKLLSEIKKESGKK